MDMLLFVVMVPVFLLLFGCWIAAAVQTHKNKAMHRQAKRDAKRWSELCEVYEAQGMSWSEAAVEASYIVYGYQRH